MLGTKPSAKFHEPANCAGLLQHSDSELSKRTWQHVMETMTPLKTGPTLTRWKRAIQDRAFDPLRNRKLIETTSLHFLQTLNAGTVSTNMFLRRSIISRWECTGSRGPCSRNCNGRK